MRFYLNELAIQWKDVFRYLDGACQLGVRTQLPEIRGFVLCRMQSWKSSPKKRLLGWGTWDTRGSTQRRYYESRNVLFIKRNKQNERNYLSSGPVLNGVVRTDSFTDFQTRYPSFHVGIERSGRLASWLAWKVNALTKNSPMIYQDTRFSKQTGPHLTARP